MTCIRSSVLACTLLALVAGGAGFAHSGGHGHGIHDPHSMNPSAAMHHLHRLLMTLDLDEDQVARLHELMRERHERLEAVSERFEQEHLEVMVAVHAEDFDERSIRKASKKLAEAQLEMMLEMARLRTDIRAELTDEQKSSMDRTLRGHLQQLKQGAMR